MLPDFRVSQMIKKKHSKLKIITKRLMCMYSFHEFKMKLKYKCETYGKKIDNSRWKLHIMYVWKMWFINRLKGKEIFVCKECKLRIDRDVGDLEYIQKLFKNHNWPGYKQVGHINEERNVVQCWILARKPS